MKIDEMTEQALVALLSAPLQVPDEGFTQRVMQSLPAPAPASREMLWPAWLFAAAGGAWLWREAGMTLPPQWLQSAQALRERLQELTGQLASVDFATAPEPTLWLPAALALVLLVTLMQLVED